MSGAFTVSFGPLLLLGASVLCTVHLSALVGRGREPHSVYRPTLVTPESQIPLVSGTGTSDV
jgi:hypothetical protein